MLMEGGRSGEDLKNTVVGDIQDVKWLSERLSEHSLRVMYRKTPKLPPLNLRANEEASFTRGNCHARNHSPLLF
jgi:hypothetical protein